MIDRQICISIGDSRYSKSWRQQVTTVSALYTRLSQPIVGTETHSEYMAMPKSQQDTLKDVGGFVGGVLNAPQRNKANVTGRDIITLDFDNIPPNGIEFIERRIKAMNINYCIYSTRKHTPAKPRLRIIIPLDRSVTPDEYEPIARRIAQQIGIDMADKTTYDINRLMYWPSKCADTDFYFSSDLEKPFVNVDNILGSYQDWHDVQSWPRAASEINDVKHQLKEQEDPLEKAGIVGAFCRTYTIEQAMDLFLPGIYELVDNADNRYTYLNGSTTGGAIVYEGKFLYSHHATDPCGEKLCNSFDMVRLHRFGTLDADIKPDTPITKMPSFLKMRDLVLEDRKCRATLDKDRQEAAGEHLYLDERIELMAIKKQQEHKEYDTRIGVIREFVNRKVPKDWLKYPIDKRKMYWGTATQQQGNEELVIRDRISALEIWVELFNKNQADIQDKDTRKINSILDNLDGWERANGPMRINNDYGKQRCYIRKNGNN